MNHGNCGCGRLGACWEKRSCGCSTDHGQDFPCAKHATRHLRTTTDAITLVAWRSGRAWSGYHIERAGQLYCGLPCPKNATGISRTACRPEWWGKVCLSCRAALLRESPQAVGDANDAA